uniref:Fanconi anemia group M protein MHF binding domain-containing protein n=1 Tax=Sphenodon punctatus TaxID=8508 RepID=A0A8D0GFM8_SPHPU
MEMIERMRDEEEGDCSYVLEVQPYLHREDVNASNGWKSKSRLSSSNSRLAQKTLSSRKSVAPAARGWLCTSSMEEFDAESASLFKPTSFKKMKRPSAPNPSTPVLTNKFVCTDNNHLLDSSLAMAGPLAEHTSCKCLSEEKPGQGNELIDTSHLSASVVNHASRTIKELEPTTKDSSLLNRNKVDSGYGSFTEEKSPVSSSMFYCPASELDTFAHTG